MSRKKRIVSVAFGGILFLVGIVWMLSMAITAFPATFVQVLAAVVLCTVGGVILVLRTDPSNDVLQENVPFRPRIILGKRKK